MDAEPEQGVRGKPGTLRRLEELEKTYDGPIPPLVLAHWRSGRRQEAQHRIEVNATP